MKIQPVFEAGLLGEPCGTPPFGSGPFGQAGLLARFMITAWPAMALATSESVGHVRELPLGSMKDEARTATRAPSFAACWRVMQRYSARPESLRPKVCRCTIRATTDN